MKPTFFLIYKKILKIKRDLKGELIRSNQEGEYDQSVMYTCTYVYIYIYIYMNYHNETPHTVQLL
jgi:hypothetical protein